MPLNINGNKGIMRKMAKPQLTQISQTLQLSLDKGHKDYKRRFIR